MGQEASWIAFGMAALSMLGTAVAAWNARKVARDKLEFDAKVITLEDEVKKCAEDRAELREGLDKCQDEHEKTNKTLEKTTAALEREREARHKLEVRVASLERKNGPTGEYS